MCGHPKDEDVVKEMLDVLDKVAVLIKLMVSLGMDGPIVSKSIMKKLDQVKKRKRISAIGKMPSKLHSCVPQQLWKKVWPNMVTVLKSCVSVCITSSRGAHAEVRIYLKLKTLGQDELVVLHHVLNHCLSLLPALQSDVAIKSSVNELLLEELPKNGRSIANSDEYHAIKRSLDSREVEIEFLISIKPICDEFMTKFQMEKLMIHLLHSSCVKMLKVALEGCWKGMFALTRRARHWKKLVLRLQLKNDQFKTMQGKQNATV